MTNYYRCGLNIYAILVVLACGPSTFAQINYWTGNGASNDFGDGSNWNSSLPPDLLFVESRIGSAIPNLPDATETLATVTVDYSATPAPRLVLGEGTTGEGTPYEGALEITSGGFLIVQQGALDDNGNLEVGNNGGAGFLSVTGNGMLQVGGQIASNGGSNGNSSITIADSATVSASSLFLERHLTIAGGNVDFSVTTDAILGQFGTHEWTFSPSSGMPSVLSVGGELSLDGTLKINTRGETPQVGQSWVIADSASVIQGFTRVDKSDAGDLGQGVSFRATQSPGGANGVLTTVTVEQQPVLVVNRQTGNISIRNPGTSATIAVDSYDVLSSSGGLDVAGWNSLAPSSGWQAANPGNSNLSELNALGSQAFQPDSTADLGNVFQPIALPFGGNAEDLQFKFSPVGGPEVDGLIVYEGIPVDNLTLNIDRTTGATQIINGFRDPVEIDTYTITSEAGSLDVGAEGFEPIGAGWQVAEAESDAVSELHPLSMLTLESGASQSLGNLFNVDGAASAEDLVFQFSLPTENFSRIGKVVFADELTVLSQGMPGDFDGDGSVDATDYAVWRDNLGQSSAALNGNGSGDVSGLVVQADYQLWKSQYQPAGLAAATSASVPEPTTWILVALSLGPCSSVRRRQANPPRS